MGEAPCEKFDRLSQEQNLSLKLPLVESALYIADNDKPRPVPCRA